MLDAPRLHLPPASLAPLVSLPSCLPTGRPVGRPTGRTTGRPRPPIPPSLAGAHRVGGGRAQAQAVSLRVGAGTLGPLHLTDARCASLPASWRTAIREHGPSGKV